MVGSFDVVGDMAIVIIPEELKHRDKLIGNTVLASNARIKVVAKRAGIYGGEYRTIPLQIIAGEKRLETLVKEFGLSYLVNPGAVYFSVRSGHERKRIASLVGAGESVLVLFSGIAPYPLVISKFSDAKLIVGIEKNPVAHRYALKNLDLNRKLENIRLFLGDARKVLAGLGQRFDRVVMPLPKGGECFLSEAIGVLQQEGTIHFYQMWKEGCFDQVVDRVRRACVRENRIMKSARITRCGHCAPRLYRVCVDAEIVTSRQHPLCGR